MRTLGDAWLLLDPPADQEPKPRWGAGEWVVLALYLALVGFGIAHHVPWTDETQAWLLAKENGLGALLAHRMHYEGTPGLWHFWLKALQAVGCSFTAMRWVAGALGAGAVVLLLRWSPLPPAVRWLLPLGFWLAYQDAVVARSYVLLAPLGFAAVALLRQRGGRPVWAVAVCVGLLGNVSLHGWLVALGLAAVAAVVWHCGAVRGWGWAMLLIAALLSGAAATMVPARDLDFPVASNLHKEISKAGQVLGLRTAAAPAQPAGDPGLGGLTRQPVAPHVRQGWARSWHKLARVLGAWTFPIARPGWLALLLLALTTAQAGLRRGPGPRLLGMLPYALPAGVFASLYLAPRHTGALWTALVMGAWLTWPTRQELAGRRLVLARAAAGVWVLVLLLQAGWTAQALASEWHQPYSPDKRAAEWLQAGHAGARGVAGFYYASIGPLAYFPRNIYINQPPHRWWLWSIGARSTLTAEEVARRAPAFVVVGGVDTGPEFDVSVDWTRADPTRAEDAADADVYRVRAFFLAHGYHDAALFCGRSPMRASWSEAICLRVLEHDAPGARGAP